MQVLIPARAPAIFFKNRSEFSILLSIVPATKSLEQRQGPSYPLSVGQAGKCEIVLPNLSLQTRNLRTSSGDAMAKVFFPGNDHRYDSNCVCKLHFWR